MNLLIYAFLMIALGLAVVFYALYYKMDDKRIYKFVAEKTFGWDTWDGLRFASTRVYKNGYGKIECYHTYDEGGYKPWEHPNYSSFIYYVKNTDLKEVVRENKTRNVKPFIS